MVTKYSIKSMHNEGGLPPISEAWWESILTDEELEINSFSSRYPSPPVDEKPTADVLENETQSVDWEYVYELFHLDKAISLEVTGYNRGGLLVGGENIQGFVPVSHIVDMPGSLDEDEQESLLESYLSVSLCLKVIECDQSRGRIVFSERAALSEQGSRTSLLKRLEPGNCVEGTVTNVTDFGVFVDLGGVEGLVHVSEISWGRVHHPSNVVKVNQKVRVHVIGIDRERARVALSLKRLCSNPWETAEQRYFPGQVTDAIITSIVPFGAFARIEEGLDGLIHVSEFSSPSNGNDDAQTQVEEGQTVQVRILHVDAAHQRLGLSLRLTE
ncbi:MAG: 30S ribosomal protein S1 [Anaerolineales bacterium]|nr:30S ribosomal protein S1 [Anaerolineales bacterium]